MFELNIDTRIASVKRREKITAGSVGIQCGFTFSAEWDGLDKTAVFETDKRKIAIVLTAPTVTIPWEVCEEAELDVIVGVYGTNGDGTIVIPTIYAKLGTVAVGTTTDDADNAQTPTATDVQQITAAAANAVSTANTANNTADEAKSIAQSVEQRANAGEFDGKDGLNGADGVDGRDGQSVTIRTISESTASGGTSVVTFSDGKTLSIKNGLDGQGGGGGTDQIVTYDYSSADYSTIKTAVDSGKTVVIRDAGSILSWSTGDGGVAFSGTVYLRLTHLYPTYAEFHGAATVGGNKYDLRLTIKKDGTKIAEAFMLGGGGGEGGGLTTELTDALVTYFSHVTGTFDDGNGQRYINAVLTALGASPEKPDEPDVQITYSVTTNLDHCRLSNSSTSVNEGDSYRASIISDDGYSLSTASCTVGGISQTISDGEIFINAVYGDIVINAVCAKELQPIGEATHLLNKGNIQCYSDDGQTAITESYQYGQTLDVYSPVFNSDTTVYITLTPTESAKIRSHIAGAIDPSTVSGTGLQMINCVRGVVGYSYVSYPTVKQIEVVVPRGMQLAMAYNATVDYRDMITAVY